MGKKERVTGTILEFGGALIRYMQFRSFFAGLSILFLAGVLFSSFTVYRSGLDDDILSHTNKFRSSKGKKALIMRDDLNAIAASHSRNMARGKVPFGHSGFNKRSAEARSHIKGMNAFAENVAYGETSAKEVVDDWKKSPGHRRNMLGNYTYIGIGTAKDKNGRIYYTQVFAD